MIGINCNTTNNICNNSCSMITSPICNNDNLCVNDESYLSVLNGAILIAKITGSYYYQGKTISYDSGNVLLGQTFRLSLPQGARFIGVDVFYLDRSFNWKQILHDFHQVADKYCYVVIGTILSATCTSVPCS